jgi:hypothetical protein
MKILDNSDSTVLARGSILDQVHNIAIELIIDIDSQTILKAEGQMVKVPFPSCKPGLINLDKIVGMKLDAGISQRISNTVGGKNGCIHLSEVTVETIRLAANTIFGIKCGGREWREGELSDDEFWGRVKPLLKGTCRVFQDENRIE